MSDSLSPSRSTSTRRRSESVERPSGTVGEAIPEEITVQGTAIDLKEFVFECNRLDAIPKDERDGIDEMKTKLKRERLDRKRRIERADIPFEEGEHLVESIRGIDRAIGALEDVDAPGIGERMRRQKIKSAGKLKTPLDLSRRL